MDDTIALIQFIDLTTGVQASYWKPVGLVFVETEPALRVYLAGYADQKANDSGASPMALVQVDLPSDQTDIIRATKQFPSKAMLMNFVSANPLFKGATRVMGSTDPVVPDVKRGGFSAKTA